MTHSDAAAADLFGSEPAELQLAPQALLLQGFALPYVPRLLTALQAIEQTAPFRHMRTPGGLEMSVALTNCGALGWTSDSRGYRYAAHDPDTGRPWLPLPEVLLQLAHAAAERAGFAHFVPDACLVNRYLPGARLSLHQDKDERDYSAPIVSVSLGIAATFLLGGFSRSDKTLRVPLAHGDVVVWGGADRLRYHGVLAVPPAEHPLLGAQRINLTLRKAG
ncbi:DNA oxidative demethylase AlkB [Rhodoferax sp.]|uniref:DNA oxidative demethylase AlkB n=1 Tax=Rhodoferax sp. TaxID=50421 RepID=UPI00374DAFA2